MEALNLSLFLMINAGADPAPGMLWVAIIVAQWLIYGVPLLLAGFWLWGGPQRRAAVLVATLSLLVALSCNQLIAAVWMHPRPFMIQLGHTFMGHDAESSFPSDHAVVFFSVGLALIWSALRNVGTLLVLIGVVVGGSRVYLGVHFPFDIIGAFLVAIVSSWVVITGLSVGQVKQQLLLGLEGLYRRLFAFAINKGWVQA
ncbi:phosphatase PAP2 family protein [Pseudomonas sp. MH9.2]|uniref:phosphatase PAP2 family protein n=1 Tax=Pseudomonas sp. MH9.2 TaxID=3048629 RepID=UPI002AC8CB0A|nr:phosphatase PAP2 family protein [Pseudomonas sp. MH9.2]MEB0028700.1 phosphatase PAP2 family protein [Pseudomonas sp. MH9.2]WPX70303.1 phosphatase PAP2 family protein [Pseudomonas sp. MH9.2]